MIDDLAHVTRALGIYAHPNDAETSAGGTLARLAEQGAAVHLLICARGDKGSTNASTDPSALAEERRQEALAAGAVLGLAGTSFLDLPDGTIDGRSDDIVGALVEAVRMIQPDVVFGPDPTAVFFGDTYVNHRDHREVGWAVLDAIASAAANPHYFPDQFTAGLRPHGTRDLYLSGTLEPNVSVDISGMLDRKIDAIFEHRSQLATADAAFRTFLEERAGEVGRGAGLGPAEAFRRVRLRG